MKPRWTDKAMSNDSGPVWYQRLALRYRTARSYWSGVNGDRPKHFDLLRDTALADPVRPSWAKKNPNREDIVTYYEGLVEYLLAWVVDHDGTITELMNDLNYTRQQAQTFEKFLQNEQEARHMVEEQVATLQWALQQAYKSRG